MTNHQDGLPMEDDRSHYPKDWVSVDIERCNDIFQRNDERQIYCYKRKGHGKDHSYWLWMSRKLFKLELKYR